MSDPSPLTDNQMKRLMQVILKDKSADARKAALLEIRHSDDPRVSELLEHVSRKDSDWQVRDLAKNLLAKKRIQNSLQTTGNESHSGTPILGELATDDSRTDPWKCGFCDADNDGADRCPSCGADRPVSNARPDQKIRLDDVFFFDKGNRDFAAAKKKRLNTQANGCLFLFFIPFVIIGIGAIVMLILSLRDWQTLNTRGVTTQGTFIEKFSHADSDNDTTYTARYQFMLGDDVYSNNQDVSREFYNRVETGVRVDILYDPFNPGLSVLDGYNELGASMFFFIFGCIWNAVTWPLVIGFASMGLRDRRLSREGRVLNGYVLSSSGQSDSDNDFHLKIEYTFRSPENNQPVIKSESRMRNDLKRAPLPAANTPVIVVYRNAQHFKML